MPKDKKTLLNFWEDQMRQSHTSSNYFFRKVTFSLSHDVISDVSL